jgi:hypothetical protein
VRECIGYARTPAEAAATLTVQQFEHGLMVGVDSPEGRVIYVIGAAAYQDAPARGTYERYAAPGR